MDIAARILLELFGGPVLALLLVMPIAMGKAIINEIRGPQAPTAIELTLDPALVPLADESAAAWMGDDVEPERSVNEVFVSNQ